MNDAQQGHQIDPIMLILISIFLGLLTYAAYLSYRSIDYKILEKLESSPLVLPSPPPAATSISTPSASPKN